MAEHSDSDMRMRLVCESHKELDAHIEQLEKSGWRVAMIQICYQTKNEKVYIAELKKRQ